ncbi:efflux pump, RND family, inner and outer membrane proteins [Geotalea daltonii FRC-32]|uniref:Efflux pump, RND family, inner and outer membrane proteins n=1 Tax=Geotalea daltonii (strain DSM 22248 / JCM 15807 / FRC-32) TaxID=316067 RepID=B9M2D1_GEODF|nr:efflux RND transporter permease subunit [Geotalea daltonii]ACM19310.1 efflux pump, RND family, inner and outer membrane proteins [Geotalea daltonii FRC-32]
MVLSELSIKRPVFAAVMMLALVVLGIFSYRRLSVEMYPNVEIPVISIVTKFPGASPETVEREVSKRIEEAVNQVAGVKHVMSFSRESVSTVVVEFRLEEQLNDVAQEARAKITSIRGDLPTATEEPIIQKLDFNAMPVAALAVQSETLLPRELTVLVEKRVKKRFESIAGVGKVDMIGGQKREVNVEIDPARLDAVGLGVNDVVDGLRSENTNTPLGRLTRGGAEYPLRMEGKPERADDYRQMVIARSNGRPVTLAEVAAVGDGVEEKRRLALINGIPAIGLDIYKQSGANQVQVVDNIKKIMGKVEKDLPPGVRLSMVRDGSIMTRDSLADVQETLLIGGILTIVIVFCFINSWRSTVITGVTLPISVISSFIVMNAMGMTLNVMTLMALSLAIGLLIDDAIVVRENIVRHLEHGKDHMEASRFGTAEIGLAVFATTMSVVAVFVPVAFMKGIVGRFFFPFGITVSFAVLVSLFVSFTLDPMLSSRWHDPAITARGHRKGLAKLLETFNDWFDYTADKYRSAIGWALDHRKTVMASAFAAFIAGLAIFATLESSFMATEDNGEFQVSFKTAPDASMAETENRLGLVLDRMKNIPEIDHTYATIGAGDSGTVRDGLVYVKLKEKQERTRKQQEIQQVVRERLRQIPGITFSIEIVGSMGSGKPLNANLKGEDIAVLKGLAAKLKEEMYKIPGIVDISATLEHDIPEYRLRVDRERALSAGVSTNDIVASLGRLVGGEAITTYEDEDGDAVDVRVRLPENLRQNPGQVRDLKISVPDGAGSTKLVPMSAITSYEVAATPSEINRRDLSRQVTVSANLDNLPIGTAVKKVEAAASNIRMPPGYSVNFSGEAEDMAESFGYMGESLLLAVLFVYLILAAQFESFLEPLAIMLSLPLSIVGVAGMLKLTGDTVNIMSLIGLIMLMGLVTKNAILLVDYAKVLQRRDGMPRRQAVIEAGRTRLRPIAMTTLAMIFGMLPLFFAIGSGAEGRAPMARTVIGGLLTSSLLTLLVVPVVYTVVDDLGAWLKRKWNKEHGQNSDAGAPPAGEARRGAGKVIRLLPGRRFFRGLIGALCLLCGSMVLVSRANAEVQTLTLEQALQIAAEKNRDLEKAREYFKQVEGRYVEERAAALPQLSLNGTVARDWDDSQSAFFGVSGSQDRRSAELSASQVLFSWGKVGAAIRAAKIGLKTADDQLRLYRQAAARDVSVTFYNVLLARELNAFASQNLEQKKRHLDETRKKYTEGIATEYDVLAAGVTVDNARPEVIRTENQIRTASQELRYLLALDHEIEVSGALDAAITPHATYEEAIAVAEKKRPELADLRHRLGMYEELVNVAAADNKPRLDLKGSYGWKQLEIGDNKADGFAWSAGIYLSFPFFDGFRTSGKTAQAESTVRSLKIDEAKQLDAIALDARNAVNALAESEEIVNALSGTVKQAERLLTMAEKGYELGVKIRLEVEDAELNLLQAKSNFSRAKRDYLVARVNLDWVMGVLGE